MACVAGRLRELSMTWTGCETIEDRQPDYYSSAPGLLLVLSVIDRHLLYMLHMAIKCLPRVEKDAMDAHMFSPYLGQGFQYRLK